MREYAFAAVYDAQYGTPCEPEICTLTELALKQGGAVLDLCCGTDTQDLLIHAHITCRRIP